MVDATRSTSRVPSRTAPISVASPLSSGVWLSGWCPAAATPAISARSVSSPPVMGDLVHGRLVLTGESRRIELDRPKRPAPVGCLFVTQRRTDTLHVVLHVDVERRIRRKRRPPRDERERVIRVGEVPIERLGRLLELERLHAVQEPRIAEAGHDEVHDVAGILRGRKVVSRVPWKSSGVASVELVYLSRLPVVKPKRRGVIAFREAA